MGFALVIVVALLVAAGVWYFRVPAAPEAHREPDTRFRPAPYFEVDRAVDPPPVVSVG